MAAKTNRKSTAKNKKNQKNVRASTRTPRDVESMMRRNRIIGWSMLGLAVAMMLAVLIPGESGWRAIHNVFLGLFGYLSFCFPILLGYIAVVIATGRSSKPRAIGRTLLITAIVLMACAIGYAFQYGDLQAGQNFFQNLGEMYQEGTQWRSAGLFGGLIGIPFVAVFGPSGAKILTIVVFAVLVLILTGVSMMQVRDAVAKPTKKVAEGISIAKEAAVERREIRRAAKAEQERQALEQDRQDLDFDIDRIDIPMDGEKRETAEEEAERRARQKRDNLRRAFGIEAREEQEETKAESAAPAAAETEEETVKQKNQQRSVSFFESGEEVDVLDIPMGDFGEEAQKKTEKKETAKEKAEPVSSSRTVRKQSAGQKPEPPVELTADSDAAKAAAAYAKKLEKIQQEEMNQAVVQQEQETEHYRFPPIDLLRPGQSATSPDVASELETNGQKLVDVLKSFGVTTRILDICRGPSVTRYELQPAAGVKISKITNLSDDIAMNLAASGVRIEAPIPGKAAVGVEVPNRHVSVVKMRELIEAPAFRNADSRLTVALGRDISGQIILADLAKMPHLLIAGATGSGKSVCINSLIISLLYKSSPDDVKLLMVDPKVVELGIYNGIPHLLVPVVTDPRKASGALSWAVTEMLNRYKTFADNSVRDIKGYNAMVGDGMVREDGVRLERMPQIVIIIDELADLMMAAPHEVEDSICRLAQMARAAGMHLVIATQRPSVDVITGVIKANIPSRIAFAVSSQVDSRTILDSGGAEKLLGRGDMLFAPSGSPKPVRVQGCFVDDKEVEKVVSYVKKKHESEYDNAVLEEIEKNAAENNLGKEDEADESGISSDPLMPDAIKVVMEAGQASTSLLQRRLRIGYARAGRLVDEMEQMGVVGPHEGSKPRQLLMTYQQWLEMSMQHNDAVNDANAAENGSEV